MTGPTDFCIPGPAGKLAVRSKGLEAHPANVVVLVQGANLSGQAGFDFSYPGGEDYSLMDALVARGLGALTFSLRGYGRSDAPADPAHGGYRCRDRGPGKHHGLAGRGRISASPPARVVPGAGVLRPATARSIRTGSREWCCWTRPLGGGNLIPFEPEEPWWSGGWNYFFQREAQFGPEAMRRALADYAVEHEPRSPNGIRRENARGSIAADPQALKCPVLMIYGSGAGKAAYMHGGIQRAEYFERLPAEDKALVVIPGGGDYAHLQRGRRRIQSGIADFLLQG